MIQIQISKVYNLIDLIMKHPQRRNLSQIKLAQLSVYLLVSRFASAQICDTPAITTFNVIDTEPVKLTYEYIPGLVVPLPDIVVEPTLCEPSIDYTCMLTSGPVDICSMFTPLTDPIEQTDRTILPEGLYTFDLQGTVNDQSSTVHTASQYFELTVTDPCVSVPLASTIGESDSMPELTVYRPDQPSIKLFWTFEGIASQDTTADCGPREVEFTNADGSPMISSFFKDTRIADEKYLYILSFPSFFPYAKTTYELMATVTLTDYPQNVLQSTFKVRVEDPCDNPIISAPLNLPSDRIEYILTDSTALFQVPLFSIDAFCPITYSFTVDDMMAETLVSMTVTGSNVSFDVYGNFFDMIGEHVLTLTAESSAQTATLDLDLIIITPCDKEETMQIVATTPYPEDQSFVVYSDFVDGPISFKHQPIQQVTSFWAAFACSSVKYDVTFDGVTVADSGDPNPLTYAFSTFNVATDDLSQVGSHTVNLKAYLQDYPDGLFVEFSFNIEFTNPCLQPSLLTLIPTDQTDPVDYLYTGSSPPAIFTLNPVEVDPPICEIVYSCEMTTLASFDLCQDGTFSTETGNLVMATDDPQQVPSGTYDFTITGQVDQVPTAQTEVTFSINFVDPCESAILTLDQVPFEDKELLFFGGTEFLQYSVEEMVVLSKPIDCGALDIIFTDGAGLALDPVLLRDGRDAPFDVNGKVVNFFVLLEPKDLGLNGQMISVNYRIFLEDYPSKQAFGIFQVSYELTDDCDERLVSTEILESLPQECFPDELEPEVEPESPDEEELDPEEDDDELTQEEIEKEEQIKKAIEYTPFWMTQVIGQRITYGSGVDLHYEMGDPVTFKGDLLNVTVDFGGLEIPSFYERSSNSINVINRKLKPNDIGTWDLVIDAVYREANDTIIKYTSQMYIQVIDPREKLPERPVIVPEITAEVEIQTKEELPKYGNIPWDIVLEESAIVRQKEDGPIPYIKSYSWTGDLKIGWSTKLIPYSKPQIIPGQKIAIEKAFFADSQDRRQLRDETVVFDEDLMEELRLLITDAIEIKVLEDDPDHGEDKELSSMNFTWELQEFLENEMTLKFDFRDPETASDRAAVNFDTFQMTFFGTKYFKDNQDREVPFGTTLKWKVFRQIDSESAQNVELVVENTNYVFIALGVIVLGMLLCCGPLLPFWMFFNSLQLIAHLPMLRIHLPAQANIFLLEYLQVVRFQVWKLNAFVENQLGLSDTDREDYDFILEHGDESHYNELMHASGYHVSLVRNLALVLVIGGLIGVAWLQAPFCDCCCFRRRRLDPWLNNFFVRFLYEVFFEICFCVTLSITLVSTETQRQSSWVPLAVMITLTALFAIGLCLLTYLCFRNGPYMAEVYEKGSLRKSFWHYRSMDFEQACLQCDEGFSQEKHPSQTTHKQQARPVSEIAMNTKIPITITDSTPSQANKDDLFQDKIDVQANGPTPSDDLRLSNGSKIELNRSYENPDYQTGRQSMQRGTPEVSDRLPDSIVEEFGNRDSVLGHVQVDAFDSKLQEKQSKLVLSDNVYDQINGATQLLQSQATEPMCDQPFRNKATQLLELDSNSVSKNEKGEDKVNFEGGEVEGDHTAAQTAQVSMDSMQEMPEVADEKLTIQLDSLIEDAQQVLDREDQTKPKVENEPQTKTTEPQTVGTRDPTDCGSLSELRQQGVLLNLFEFPKPKSANSCRLGAYRSFSESNLRGSSRESGFSRTISSSLSARQPLVLQAKICQEKRAELTKQARLAVILESKVQVSQRYSTLFLGLRKNHPHNCALVHPMTFLLRRLIYVVIIIFMFNMPFFATLLLLACSLALLTFAVSEYHWEDSISNQQHVVNEAVLYVCLVLMVLFCDVSVSKEGHHILGWTMIGLVAVFIVFNLLVISIQAVRHTKRLVLNQVKQRLVKSHQARRGKGKNNKVAPFTDESLEDGDIHTGRALMKHNDDENPQYTIPLNPILEEDAERSSILSNGEMKRAIENCDLSSELSRLSLNNKSGLIGQSPRGIKGALESNQKSYQASYASPKDVRQKDSSLAQNEVDMGHLNLSKTQSQANFPKSLYESSDNSLGCDERSESVEMPKASLVNGFKSAEPVSVSLSEIAKGIKIKNKFGQPKLSQIDEEGTSKANKLKQRREQSRSGLAGIGSPEIPIKFRNDAPKFVQANKIKSQKMPYESQRLHSSMGNMTSEGDESKVASFIHDKRAKHANLQSESDEQNNFFTQRSMEEPVRESLDVQKSAKWLMNTMLPVTRQQSPVSKPVQEVEVAKPKKLQAGPKFMSQKRMRPLLSAASSMIDESPQVPQSQERTLTKKKAKTTNRGKKEKSAGRKPVKRGNLV